MVDDAPPRIGVVVIGRNEGARLIACLDSLAAAGLGRVVYVDSGSTDGSPAAAAARGVQVVALDDATAFTAARGRNAGVAALTASSDPIDLVQFIDGDCTIAPTWITIAATFLNRNPTVAVVCGRRREQMPEASLYNRLIDREWDTPVGPARACGGDALMRLAAFEAVGGFDASLIAGEEPELCVRLRAAGWAVWRLDAEMTFHDARIYRFGQWWTRARRAGHAFAEGATMHGGGPEQHNVAQTRRALAWGVGVPALAGIGGLAIHPALWLVLLAWPAQVLRLWRRSGDGTQALFLTLAKIPEAQGVLEYRAKRLTARRSRLIEYK